MSQAERAASLKNEVMIKCGVLEWRKKPERGPRVGNNSQARFRISGHDNYERAREPHDADSIDSWSQAHEKQGSDE